MAPCLFVCLVGMGLIRMDSTHDADSVDGWIAFCSHHVRNHLDGNGFVLRADAGTRFKQNSRAGPDSFYPTSFSAQPVDDADYSGQHSDVGLLHRLKGALVHVVSFAAYPRRLVCRRDDCQRLRHYIAN